MLHFVFFWGLVCGGSLGVTGSPLDIFSLKILTSKIKVANEKEKKILQSYLCSCFDNQPVN